MRVSLFLAGTRARARGIFFVPRRRARNPWTVLISEHIIKPTEDCRCCCFGIVLSNRVREFAVVYYISHIPSHRERRPEALAWDRSPARNSLLPTCCPTNGEYLEQYPATTISSVMMLRTSSSSSSQPRRGAPRLAAAAQDLLERLPTLTELNLDPPHFISDNTNKHFWPDLLASFHGGRGRALRSACLSLDLF